MFTELSLPSFLDTSSNDIINDFFVPVLAHASRYDRGVGFFSSGWLRMTAKGMIKFAANGGQARWVTSPILSGSDWNALNTGNQARINPILKEILRSNILELEASLKKDTLSALAWMVADEILDFKLALPQNKLDQGDFHDKFGIFTDAEGNQISFNGSYNDSIQGTRNYESIKVFCSWNSAFSPLVISDIDRFEKLWNDDDPNVRVYDLPDAARQKIVRLRSGERPYHNSKYSIIESIGYFPKRPAIPKDIKLRDYQLEAINAWIKNDYQGLFEMATGTGKTITSLGASLRLIEEKKRLALIIACPYQHLVDQWFDEAKDFGYSPIRAYKSRKTWLDNLSEKVISYNYKDIDYLCVVTTHATFATRHFQKIIEDIKSPKLLIADEVHHLGSSNRRDFLPSSFKYRLALSATPNRWYDDLGTQAIRNYFGMTVFELSLSDAIGLSLTPYYYYPVLVELNDDEMDEYRALSTKIGQLIAQDKDESDEYLTQLLIKRSRILNNAKNKIGILEGLIEQDDSICNTLVYCSPGGQIDEVMRLLGIEKRIRAHRFTADEDIPTRIQLLERFSNGELQVLVAMKCLDEGVDVPSTRIAYILASSSNPREFIQRRGRVLRKHSGKDFAKIFDLITVPPPISELDEYSVKAEQSILRRELKRFVEFADSANNTQEAYNVVWGLADQFNVLDALEEDASL